MKKLNKEVNIKFIILLMLINILAIGFYSSYALFEVSVIQDNVIVLKTGTVDIETTVTGSTDQTFTLAQGETKNITVTLSSTATSSVGYKMYYDITQGISDFIVTSTETFTNDIVEGVMTTTKTITFTFQNTGSNDITIFLGTQGGLSAYPIILEQGIELVLNEELGVPIKNAIVTSVNNPTNTSCKTYVEEDGIIYISGTNDCIDFNYVWYSGKLWRITAIYPDGTIKMITDDMITSISYGTDYNFYTDESTTSWIYQWLNEDFLDTLYNYENIIKTDSTWNVTSGNGTISTKLAETTMVPAKVGLLNSYEYYMSYKNTYCLSGYLNIRYMWWLSNPYNSASSSDVWYVFFNGEGDYSSLGSYTYGVRPAVNLQSTIQLEGGTGIKTDPYRIKGDKEDAVSNTTLLNTRSSGEYVNFDGETYRIVGIENDTTKINKVDYIRDESDTVITKYFASSTTFGKDTNTQSEDYWDYYLNNTWYNSISSDYKSMLEQGTYYLGIVGVVTRSYKLAICATPSNIVSTKDCTKTSTTYSGYVGLPRYGEMFSSQLGSGYSTSSNMWLITPYDLSYVWHVSEDGYGFIYSPSSDARGVRPSINLKSTILIKSGSGTKGDPFVVGLPEDQTGDDE